ncbi:21949_t:CDS:2, partial [Racocetra persica]
CLDLAELKPPHFNCRGYATSVFLKRQSAAFFSFFFGSSKKRRIDVEIVAASLVRQQELPYSITRSEAYKGASIRNVKSDEFLYLPSEPLSERLRNYLAKSKKPDKNSKEDVQAWFNGLIGFQMINGCRQLLWTRLDKGQLLDYIYVMVQQQPSRQLFSASLLDRIFFYMVTFDKGVNIYKEINLKLVNGFALFWHMIARESPYTEIVKD